MPHTSRAATGGARQVHNLLADVDTIVRDEAVDHSLHLQRLWNA
jgi:hypothetical protein